MENAAFEACYKRYLQAIEDYLNSLFSESTHWSDLYASMRYSILAGGKRIRPVLTLEFARLSGMDWHDAVPVACALELVHTYSLIHDDLPCMDDDDLRRGKPTNHKVYGETLAVLAGDALQAEAYRLILTASHLTAEQKVQCALILSRASGADGMVAGQVIDTLHAPQTEAALAEVHHLKTGAMIAGACMLGVAAAGGDAKALAAAEEYGYQLGLAFQVRDDMLDVLGTAEEFGKPIGSDKEEGKVTYIDLLGPEGCERMVRATTDKALMAVEAYDADGFLTALAEKLIHRSK